MSFNYYDSYYGYPVATKIRGSIGNKFTYQLRHNKQYKIKYYVPTNPRTAPQQANRDKIKYAVLKWHSLTEIQKNFYRKKEPIRPTMSGYNFFIREYMKSL